MKAARMLHLAVCQLRQCQLLNQAKSLGRCRPVMNQFSTSPNKQSQDQLSQNPYFEKYASKIQQLKEFSPEEFEARLDDLTKSKTKHSSSPQEAEQEETPKQEHTKPPIGVPNQPSPVKPKCLDDVLKLDLIRDKSRSEIEQIWKQYHSKRSGVFAVIEGEEYLAMLQKAQACTLFIYPLPKPTGYEFVLAQWSGHECHFTPLSSYQKHQENSPTCMSLIHYPELIEDKGIALMAGEFDSEVVKPQEATMLAQQVQFYYGLSRNPERFELVRLFNNSPQNFNYLGLISQFEKLGLGFAS